ncbi:prepilin peptidase [Candidatus Saccharibacteria bacterium]|nr:prepilin peptidase [Candidatus Saccharibacteria bacterium]
MKVFILISLFILGAVMGSFVCCQVRRAKLSTRKKKKAGDRSICLNCGYQLKWFDNIPIFSWIFLKGKCRKCGKKIGGLEILSELGFGFVFLVIGGFASESLEYAVLGPLYLMVLLAFVTILGYLAIFDGKYGELPGKALTFSVICGIILLILKQWSLFLSSQSFQFLPDSLLSALGGVGVLAGTYYLLYFFSKEKLVGSGDWILGLAISLTLGSWWLALIVIFLSNALAAIFMAPSAIKKEKKKIYFGPWMVLAFVIVFIFQEYLLRFIVF